MEGREGEGTHRYLRRGRGTPKVYECENVSGESREKEEEEMRWLNGLITGGRCNAHVRQDDTTS